MGERSRAPPAPEATAAGTKVSVCSSSEGTSGSECVPAWEAGSGEAHSPPAWAWGPQARK